MFKSGQDQAINPKNRHKTEILKYGMTLVKKHSMKQRFTYKELTLILGIVVALLVAFSLWHNTPGGQAQGSFFHFSSAQSFRSMIVAITGIN
jgi:hypothetical protein